MYTQTHIHVYTQMQMYIHTNMQTLTYEPKKKRSQELVGSQTELIGTILTCGFSCSTVPTCNTKQNKTIQNNTIQCTYGAPPDPERQMYMVERKTEGKQD